MPSRAATRSALLIAALLLLEIFCWIEVDLYAPSFPQIRQHFGTSEAMVQWTLSLNFMGYFASSLLVGPLADSFGRKPVILAGSGIFALGSLVCLMAPNLNVLLAGRLIQGIGVSAPTTLAITIVSDLWDGDRQVKISSLMNSIVTITMAAAPMAGAWLSARWGWRSNFLLIFCGALASTALVALLVPETHGPGRRRPFSPGQVLRTYGVLLSSGFFLATTLGLVLLVTPYWIFIATIPFLFQESLGVPMARYVYLQGAVVGMFSLLSLAAPLFIGKVDTRRALLGSILLTLGTSAALCLQALFLKDSATWITAMMCLFIVGIVWPCTCFYAMVFAAFPALKGSASSLCSALRMMVMAACISLNAHLYTGSFRSVGVLIFLLVCAGFPLLVLAARRRDAFAWQSQEPGMH